VSAVKLHVRLASIIMAEDRIPDVIGFA